MFSQKFWRHSQFSNWLQSQVALHDNQAALLCLCSENDVVAFLPALYNKSFTWEDVRGESGIHLFDALRVSRWELFLNSACAEAIRAETMQNWCFEASHSRHLRVDMKRIPVVAKSVKESLVALSHFFFNKVRCALRWLWELGFNSPFVPESAESPHKKTSSNCRLQFTSVSFKNFSIQNKDGTLSFVLEVCNTLFNDILITWD